MMTLLDDVLARVMANQYANMDIQLDPDRCQAHQIEYYGKGVHVTQCRDQPDHEGDHVCQDGG